MYDQTNEPMDQKSQRQMYGGYGSGSGMGSGSDLFKQLLNRSGQMPSNQQPLLNQVPGQPSGYAPVGEIGQRIDGGSQPIPMWGGGWGSSIGRPPDLGGMMGGDIFNKMPVSGGIMGKMMGQRKQGY